MVGPAGGSLRVENIGSLVVVPAGPLPGESMRHVSSISGATLVVSAGRIEWFGPSSEAPTRDGRPVIDARGGTVVPGLIDCHTHIPFAGQRSAEFEMRLEGRTYLEIMEAGGGIRVTTAAVRAASEDELFRANLPRLARMLRSGVTTCECKSGYGLEPEAELKQLRVTRRLAEAQPIELVPTYLGAHAVPAEFADRADAFIDEIASEALLTRIRDEGLARFVDVFCDRGAFTVAQARRVLERAAAVGLRGKLHADELAQIGASKLAGEMGCISADHLELIDDAGIAAMHAAGTIAVVLPGTSFFLGIPHCDARRLIRAGLAVAISTDCNPGSSMIESLPLIMNIACCQLRMTPVETLVACTANAAAAIGEHRRIGAIAQGFDADLVVLDCPTLAEWLYTPGRNRVQAVIKRGVVQVENALLH